MLFSSQSDSPQRPTGPLFPGREYALQAQTRAQSFAPTEGRKKSHKKLPAGVDIPLSDSYRAIGWCTDMWCGCSFHTLLIGSERREEALLGLDNHPAFHYGP